MKLPKKSKREDVYTVWKPAHFREKIDKLKRGEIITPTHIQVDLTGRCNYNCIHCLPPNEKIITNNEIKEISKIEIGNKVLTHTGNYRRVTRRFKHNFKGNLVCIKAFGDIIRLTPNHKVFAIPRGKWDKLYKSIKRDPKWIDVEKLKKGDLLLFPRIKIQRDKTLKISDYVNNFILNDEFIYARGWSPFGGLPKSGHRVKNIIRVNNDFLFILGLYLSEGYISRRGIIFTLNKNEKKLINKLRKSIIKIFGITPSEFIREKNDTTMITINSRVISDFFSKLFGSNSKTKKIPQWVIELPNKKLEILIRSMWAGDGSIEKKKRRATYVTTTKKIKDFLKLALIKIGLVPSIWFNKKNNSFNIGISGKQIKWFGIQPHNRAYNMSGIDDNYAYIPIRDISLESYDGLVYNLEVENDETYTANFIVHNCFYRNAGFKHLEFVPNEEIPVDIGLGLFDQMADLGIPAVELTGGGEPLLYPAIKECLDRIAERKLELAIVTNGSLFNEEILDRVKNPKWIRFSIDAATPKCYARYHQVRPEYFTIVLKNLQRVIDENFKDCLIGVSFIIAPENYEEIVKATRLFKGMGVHNIRFSFAYTTKYDKLLSLKERKETFDLLRKAKNFEDKDFRVFVMESRLDDFSPRAVREKEFQFCGYQMFTFQIGCDCLVYPCCVEKYHKPFAFGDIRKQTLKEIIFGEERKKYIENFDVNKCLPCWLKHRNMAIEYLCLEDPPHKNFV